MNNFLLINKNIILIIIFLSLFFLLLYIYQQNLFIDKNNLQNENKQSLSADSADLIKPKFSINRSKDNITVSANEGNFITEDKILLKKDVQLKTDDFEIISQNATFNQKSQTASSNTDSKFFSDGTTILSQGFDIKNSGDNISFKGKTKIILSK